MDIGGAFTDRLLEAAGIEPGASALDVGCGVGDVTLRLARLVGPTGRVLGIDTNEKALEVAAGRAREEALSNIVFERRDVGALGGVDRRFDVVACRRVLMYLTDQHEVAAKFREALRPRGVLIVQEHDATVLRSSRPLPIFERARDWIWRTVAAEGADPGTGFALHEILSAVGFADIRVSAEAMVMTPDDPGSTAKIVQAMADRIEAAEVATVDEMG
ncbi:MAG: methyltransferase domain-containing protein, partial [Pseudomonadota bacterium]